MHVFLKYTNVDKCKDIIFWEQAISKTSQNNIFLECKLAKYFPILIVSNRKVIFALITKKNMYFDVHTPILYDLEMVQWYCRMGQDEWIWFLFTYRVWSGNLRYSIMHACHVLYKLQRLLAVIQHECFDVYILNIQFHSLTISFEGTSTCGRLRAVYQ